MAIKIAIANKKGGVGKTTTAFNLAALLAEMGHKVLAMDLDSQASLTMYFGIDIDALEKSITEVFLQKMQLSDIIVNAYDRLDIAPSRSDLAKTVLSDEFLLKNYIGKRWRYNLLKQTADAVNDRYDFIIIDTTPDANSFPAMNGLAYADYAIVPMEPEPLPLYGIRQITDIFSDVKLEYINRNLKVIGILLTKTRSNIRICRDCTDLLQQTQFADLVFKTTIRRSQSLPKSSQLHRPITFFLKTCGYSDYKDFAIELLDRIGRVQA